MTWRPAQSGGHLRDWPEPGELVAVNRTPYRVVEVRARELVDWSAESRDEWEASGFPEPWQYAPHALVCQPVTGGRPVHFSVNRRHLWSHVHRLPEHYAVCAQCGELAPCMETTSAQQAAVEMERFERLANILPGCCWSCGEPITSRQHALTYDGPNVWMPTAPEGVRFHERRACLSAATRYENDWAAADAARRRTLLTLACAGTLTVHADGSAECYGAESSDCPTIHARHRGYQACFTLTHGCPLGCSQVGHPGCHVRRPKRIQSDLFGGAS